MTKIHIIGGPGSGKSYIAAKLSKMLGLSTHELDNFFWDHESEYFGSQTPPVKRAEKLAKVVSQEKWIIEGVYHSWIEESFHQADYIFVLKTNVYVRDWRIVKRFILRKVKLASSPRKENVKMLIDLLKWNHQYDGNNLVQAIKMMKPYKDKVIILTKNDDVFKLFKKRKKKAS
ncbi:DNA topology modulation protein FlaR [Mesobacillus selenatarsenatis]|uniref:DNA topology modulation protein FlaR n=1 Tax=Mesobacillus selenatarsenatis TaxID=388741 RepID=A0A846TC29_9BACI|nr:DNA topology modulation protein FlaR [Mesobacillus selenatarsenatis]NKE06618.1 DNA topology modulation protein FlaR [Mesobacillus selenatarsenatis]